MIIGQIPVKNKVAQVYPVPSIASVSRFSLILSYS